MIKKPIILLSFVATFLFVACSGGKDSKTTDTNTEETAAVVEEEDDAPEYDATRGEGKFDETNVDVSKMDLAMATKGQAISETKCLSCHKLSDERLVGPGWNGVTKRRTPHWLMNFITNPDPMIDKDPEVQAQLEECLVRMPNQNLAEEEARFIVEFMRKNDGAK